MLQSKTLWPKISENYKMMFVFVFFYHEHSTGHACVSILSNTHSNSGTSTRTPYSWERPGSKHVIAENSRIKQKSAPQRIDNPTLAALGNLTGQQRRGSQRTCFNTGKGRKQKCCFTYAAAGLETNNPQSFGGRLRLTVTIVRVSKRCHQATTSMRWLYTQSGRPNKTEDNGKPQHAERQRLMKVHHCTDVFKHAYSVTWRSIADWGNRIFEQRVWTDRRLRQFNAPLTTESVSSRHIACHLPRGYDQSIKSA